MKGSVIGMVAAGCLVVGFGAGFALRPVIAPGGVGPGVTCMTQLTMDTTRANATPQNRPVGFARVNGQWEVAVW